MARAPIILWAVLAGLAAAAPALAEEGKPLRLIGEAPTATGSAPKRFFIDATVTAGDASFKSEVEGWLTALPPDSGSQT